MRTPSTVLAAVACLCFFGCEKKPTPKAADGSGNSGNPLSAPADYLGALNKAQKSAQKTAGNVGIDQALKTFVAEEGRFPKTLEELKSKGINVPTPPAGMKWDYDPNTGIVKAVPQ
ncbi:MAG TPA: hypothetical protein VK530_17535 [Candidatus Acidoferrum sp.]|nr:hypothetical protein [Candidatus Acidoferrum sp.]